MSVIFDGQRAYAHVEHLSAGIGARVMGSDAEVRACAYVRTHFETLGLQVTEQTFQVETGNHVRFEAQVMGSSPDPIRCFPMLLCPDTPPDGLVGELVYVDGAGSPQMGRHLEGKIALWSAPPESNSRDILQFKPAAVLMVSQEAGVGPKQFQMTRELAKPWERVPWFEITYEESLRLLRQGARTLRLCHQSSCHSGTCRNVIADLKGTQYPEQVVVLGAHVDTVPDLPGASDNASGCSVVMELARLWAERGGAKRTLRFVAWGAEEGGLIGSREYVRRLKARDKEERAAPTFVKGRDKTEFERHLLCVCLDVVGMTVGFSKCFVFGPPELVSTMAVLADEIGTPHKVDQGEYGSDHMPFVVAGIPSVAPARMGGGARYMHTPKDDLDLLDAAHLADVGSYIDILLQRAADAHVWPFKREVPDAVRKLLKEQLVKWGEDEAEDWAK